MVVSEPNGRRRRRAQGSVHYREGAAIIGVVRELALSKPGTRSGSRPSFSVNCQVVRINRNSAKVNTDSPTPTAASVSPFYGKRAIICEDEGVTSLQLKKVLHQAGVQVVGMASTG